MRRDTKLKKEPFLSQNTLIHMNRFIIIISLFSLLSLTSCASAKQNSWLKTHQTNINRAAQSNGSSEEKMDVLLTQYAVLMDEGLKFVNPVKGVKYIQKFQKQNDVNISKIVGESGNWVTNLSTGEGVMFGLRVAQKPYLNRYIDLVPKFHRKYEQYRFVAGLTGKIVGGFGRIGGKVLSL